MSSQLQLEIALLQGELQTEKNQLLRHTQKLQALQQEARQGERQRNDNGQTVMQCYIVRGALIELTITVQVGNVGVCRCR